jgi:hypothetical protein
MFALFYTRLSAVVPVPIRIALNRLQDQGIAWISTVICHSPFHGQNRLIISQRELENDICPNGTKWENLHVNVQPPGNIDGAAESVGWNGLDAATNDLDRKEKDKETVKWSDQSVTTIVLGHASHFSSLSEIQITICQCTLFPTAK